MNAPFDRDAYFQRIGYPGSPILDLETLRAIHLRHALTIPFENLNPLLGEPVLLDIDALQHKMVHGGRGGYCYEQNLLFRAALQSIGFKTIGLAARVVWNMPEDAVTTRTHMLLRIEVDGSAYIADVGFGGLTLTSPLRLERGVEQTTPHELFRLGGEGAEFILQARIADEWKSLYRFTLEEQLMPDYEMANWYVSSHPKSRFVNSLIAARPAEEGRYALLNNEFTVHHRNGTTERKKLATAGEIRKVLEDPIGIRIPSSARLDGALERLTLDTFL